MIRKKINYLLLRIIVLLRARSFWRKKLLEHGILNSQKVSFENNDDELWNIFKNKYLKGNLNNKIKLKNISKVYPNGFKAVDDFNLSINPNEFICLLGPSGCGKTTVLRMLAGLENITNGEYLIGNKKMNSLHPSERKTAMVFQNYALYPFMNVYNNIAFGLKLKTYKNFIVNKHLNNAFDISKPHYNKFKDIKYYIKTLKQPYRQKINELHKNLKKAKISKNISLIKKLEIDLKALKNISKKIKIRNISLIANAKNDITKLKLRYKKERKNFRLNNKVVIKENKLKIKKLKYDNKKNYKKNKIQLPELKKNIKFLKEKRNNLSLKRVSDLKTIYKVIKYYGDLDKKKNNYAKMSLKKNKYYDIINSYKSNKPFEKFNEDSFNRLKKKLLQEMKNINILFKKELDIINSKISIISSEIIFLKKSTQSQIDNLKIKRKTSFSEIILAAQAATLWKKTIPIRVKMVAKIVGLDNFLKRRPSALSGGQRQRVALIRAISKNPQLFLFDEPLSNLDAKLRISMRREIKRIHEWIGATSIYVTHDQIEAMTMADKVVVMNVGYIQQVGSPKDLYDNPADIFVAKFIGTPTINLLRGHLNNNIFKINNAKIEINLSKSKMKLLDIYKSESVILGIRPQDVNIVSNNKKSFKGIVDSVELIGSDSIVKLRSDLGLVSALVSNSLVLTKNSIVSFNINTKRISLFNTKTGRAISSLINEETKKARLVWEKGVTERIANRKLLYNESKEKSKIITQSVRTIQSTFNNKQKAKNIMNKVDDNSRIFSDYSLVSEDDEITS